MTMLIQVVFMYTHTKKTRLSQDEYYALQDQYDKTPDPQISFGATGEHYKLHYVLRQLGFSPSTKEDAYDMAGRLLSAGYSYDT